MPYDNNLAIRVREYLSEANTKLIKEKKMFGGLAFMVNDKMCINVGDKQLMCRFDPEQSEQLSRRPGFLPMTMNGKIYKGYCYVDATGFENEKDFKFWIERCLDFNDKAVSSKNRR